MTALRRLTTVPTLAGALLVATLLALGPAQPVDHLFQGYWARELTPGWWWFLDRVPNAIAGQAVCLPVLTLVAVVLARRHRTWRPILFAAAAEAGFLLVVGGMKVLLARTSPAAGDGDFWGGGALAHGWYGISYPSGHAAEAVLIYGAAAYLLATCADPDSRVLRRLAWGVGLITANAIGVAFFLGYHWPTDLVGGMFVGGLVLRVLVDLDRALAGGHVAWLTRAPAFRPATPRPVVPGVAVSATSTSGSRRPSTLVR